MEKKYPIKWEYKSHSYPIGDTGDYDGYWEVTNGKDSLITKEDYEDIEKDLQAVVDLLNNTYANFAFNRDIEAALEAENKWLRCELEELKKRQGAVWIKASKYVCSGSGFRPARIESNTGAKHVYVTLFVSKGDGEAVISDGGNVVSQKSERWDKFEILDESGTAAAPKPSFWDVAEAFKWAAEYRDEIGGQLTLYNDQWTLISEDEDGNENETKDLTPGNVAELYCLQNGFTKEGTAAGREEDAVVFHEWAINNAWEIDHREEHTHTTAELYAIFKQQNRTNENS